MTWGKEFWTYFLEIVLGIGGVAECIALATNVKNTLSEYARFELGSFDGVHFNHLTVAWGLSLVAFILVAVELVAHIWFSHWLFV